jgi:hypothetical protein
MNGSEKQVRWAEEIKTGKNFDKFIRNAKGSKMEDFVTKAVGFVTSIENAEFWIEYRDYSEVRILDCLAKGILKPGGFSENATAKISQNGEITVTEKSLI